MEFKERAQTFFEKYAPEFAANEFAVNMLANEFQAVASEQKQKDAAKILSADADEGHKK